MLRFGCCCCCACSPLQHFCDACHSGSVWPQLVTSAGVNLKTYDQYTQCAGIKDKVLAVLAKYPDDKAQQDQILSHTYCDPAQCPIGCRHLPAGFEWGAGCGMCKPSDQKNTEADKLKRVSTRALSTEPSSANRRRVAHSLCFFSCVICLFFRRRTRR